MILISVLLTVSSALPGYNLHTCQIDDEGESRCVLYSVGITANRDSVSLDSFHLLNIFGDEKKNKRYNPVDYYFMHNR